jgi:hypothetical protein
MPPLSFGARLWIKKPLKGKIVRLSLFLLLMALSINSRALYEKQGKVTSIRATGGKIIFNVCSNGQCDRFWLLPDSDYNRTVISLVMTAKVTDRTVWVGGADTPDDGWPYNGARAFSAIDFKG